MLYLECLESFEAQLFFEEVQLPAASNLFKIIFRAHISNTVKYHTKSCTQMIELLVCTAKFVASFQLTV